jgi:hypothetical protein
MGLFIEELGNELGEDRTRPVVVSEETMDLSSLHVPK